MNKLLVLFLLCVQILQAEELEIKRYTMNDFELMAKKKEWANIVLFIKDIPKSEQDLQWNSLLERASVGYVTDLAKQGSSEVERVVNDLLVEFPSLKKSYKFEAVRNEILLNGFEKCFSKAIDSSVCASEGLKQMASEFSSYDLRQKLGQLIGKNKPELWSEICQSLNSHKEPKGIFEKYCERSKSTKVQDKKK